jgi:hypothetical protein
MSDMPATQEVGKLLLILGLVSVVIGLVMMFAGRIPFLGRLPGDIRVERENFSCSFPIVTSIVVSLVLTLVLNLVMRLLNR